MAFDLARVELVYGERLRRAKEMTAARPQLAAALDTFERLGARPWAQRAANELRATGITIGHPDVAGPESLSPQQLEIAQLAAAGMSNKEIGERLFLSHRTVSTHLYQIFPKLGITSRAALRDALGHHATGPSVRSEANELSTRGHRGPRRPHRARHFPPRLALSRTR